MIFSFACRLAVVFTLFSTLSCKAREPIDGSDTSGLYRSKAGWPGATVEVCFAKDDQEDRERRVLIKETVEDEINARTHFKFTGFGPCSSSTQAMVEIEFKEQLSDANGYVRTLGTSPTWSDSVLRHIIPNFQVRNRVTFARKGRDPKDGSWKALKPEQLHGIIIHEFAHLMGIAHENLRIDNRGGVKCKGKNEISNGRQDVYPDAVSVGSYDNNSVMNDRCNTAVGTQKVSLSKGDVATINTLYPRGPGANLGYRMRYPSLKLLEYCIAPTTAGNVFSQTHGYQHCKEQKEQSLGECVLGCITEYNEGGNAVCDKPESLISCVRNGGGKSCLDQQHGQCR
jgi:hypothetical protein